MTANADFSEDQKQYLQGFAAGSELARYAGSVAAVGVVAGGATAAPDAIGPDAPGRLAQDRALAAGGKLSPEEQSKRDEHPLDIWDRMCRASAQGQFPKGSDVYRYKYHGLFFVAPAEDSFMCRLRFPGGVTDARQLAALADLAERRGGNFVDVTTRANLQIRRIEAENGPAVVTELEDLGIVCRGTGADNIRNVTGSPTAGIDPSELIDTRPLTRAMHHCILRNRSLAGLPRKFNIAFDGGGTISALAETNDIGFAAIRVAEDCEVRAGVYFRLALGGITGHLDFARDAGAILQPEECVPAAAAIVKAFIEHGDRTDRQRARLKYVIDRIGLEAFLAESEKWFGAKFMRLPPAKCEPRPPALRNAHIGFHRQKQPSLWYAGVVLPVGRLRSDQMRAVAEIAARYGSGDVRLTVWQNLLIADIRDEDRTAVQRGLEAAGLGVSASSVRAGLVACTGSGGCRFAASDTKGHALELANYLDARLQLDQPLNIHLTGCHHSCAQHYIGDIGLLAAKVSLGDDIVEGYHVYLGGGYDQQRAIGRELIRDVPFARLGPLVERLLRTYQVRRDNPQETFQAFTNRQPLDTLRGWLAEETV